MTGASGGIGRAAAREFGARGDAVALLAPGEVGLDGAAQNVCEAGGTPLPIPTDVADQEQVEAAAARVERELGEIDVWVNVAFSAVFARFVDIRPEEFRRVTEVTYLGYVWGTRAALDRMRSRDRGAIVQVGSALDQPEVAARAIVHAADHPGPHRLLLPADRRTAARRSARKPLQARRRPGWARLRRPRSLR